MKTLTFAVTDEQAEWIEAEGRRQGISPDAVVRHAVTAFLATTNEPRSDTSGNGDDAHAKSQEHHLTEDEMSDSPQPDSPQLWFIGIANEGDPERERLGSGGLNEEIARAIWEDSFGGTRAWDGTPKAQDVPPVDRDDHEHAPG